MERKEYDKQLIAEVQRMLRQKLVYTTCTLEWIANTECGQT